VSSRAVKKQTDVEEHARCEWPFKFNNNPRSFGLLDKFPEWYNDLAKSRARQRTTFANYNPYFKPNAALVPSGLRCVKCKIYCRKCNMR
jgi:hypothetical protein